jgi:hypothetical protein
MSYLNPTITETIHARQARIIDDLDACNAPPRKGVSVRLRADDVAKLDTLAAFLDGTRSSWISDLLGSAVSEAFEAMTSDEAPMGNMKVNEFTVDEFYHARLDDLSGNDLDEETRERMNMVISFRDSVEGVEAGE